MRIILSAILFSLLIFLTGCGKDLVPTKVGACNGTSEENCECFKATNKERLNNNLATMNYCETCYKMAQEHAEDMSAYGYFSHDRPARSGTAAETFYQRATRYGLGSAGENIASGATGSGAVVLWMGSPGHRANILNAGFRSFACGTKNGLSVQVFSGGLE